MQLLFAFAAAALYATTATIVRELNILRCEQQQETTSKDMQRRAVPLRQLSLLLSLYYVYCHKYRQITATLRVILTLKCTNIAPVSQIL